jgi:hypothetical protein
MREELEKRLGDLQLELVEAASARQKAQRDLTSAKLRSEAGSPSVRAGRGSLSQAKGPA